MKFTSSLIKGTFLLTTSAVICRIIGFFYKIYISNNIGTKNFGIFQLVMPLFGITSILCCHCVETSITKLVAANYNERKNYCLCGLSISSLLAIICFIILYNNSNFIATKLLFEIRCDILIKYMSITLLLSVIHSTINGYYFGIMNIILPSICNIAEQIIKLSISFLLIAMCYDNGDVPDYRIVGKSMLYSEGFSGLVGITIIILTNKLSINRSHLPKLTHYKNFLAFLFPITANKLILCSLSSIESILLPANLKVYGLSPDNAISIYGILSGMAMSVIMFPQTFTISLSSLLLPKISNLSNNNNHIQNNTNDKSVNKITKTTNYSIKLCLGIGILFAIIFISCGKAIGLILFKNETCGTFIQILGFICPFMYTNTACSSILNGLSKTGTVFICNIFAIIIRLISVGFFVPIYGINAYMYGLLISSLVTFCLNLAFIKSYNQC